MITRRQTDILLAPAGREAVERNLGSDPVRVALTAGKNADLVATQVKYLGRAKAKLPSWYAARCVIEPLAFEQCSSEAAAAAKAFAGGLCIDLTCGLGVDSHRFSKSFERVISVERDPDLWYITGHNFRLLGVDNVELVNTSAEEFMDSFTGTADLIYIDPARRDGTGGTGGAGGKQYLFEHCSPNVLAMKDKLLARTKLLVIKASPLFDADEAFRLFGNGITVEAVSVGGECKELLVAVKPGCDRGGILKATRAGAGSLEFEAFPAPGTAVEAACNTSAKDIATMRYLLIPDVTLYKIRRVREYAARNGFTSTSANGYCFAGSKPVDFFGQVREIEEAVPYQPKKLKKMLKENGIDRATILKKEFPYSTENITAALGIKEGGSRSIAFTRIDGQPYAIILSD